MMYHAPSRGGTPVYAPPMRHPGSARGEKALWPVLLGSHKSGRRAMSRPVKIDRVAGAPAAPPPPPMRGGPAPSKVTPAPNPPPFDRERALDELADLARGTHPLTDGHPVDVGALLDREDEGGAA